MDQRSQQLLPPLGQARLTFLSGAPESSIVGTTASGLLEVEEAQDVTILKFDRDVSPMGASTCVTRVFWGTAWTNATLLSCELRVAAQAEKTDGMWRVFHLNAEDVASEVAPYRKHVEEMVARLGRSHLLIRTQYFCKEMDDRGGMFPPERIARMMGDAPSASTPQSGRVYALLLDVAGEDEGARGIDGSLAIPNPKRDATALTIVEISRPAGAELSTPVEKVIHTPVDNLPVYIPVLHNEIKSMAVEWNARAVVVDATGVGAGLDSFLERSLPGRVFPFTHNSVLILSCAGKSGETLRVARGSGDLVVELSCPDQTLVVIDINGSVESLPLINGKAALLLGTEETGVFILKPADEVKYCAAGQSILVIEVV